MTANARGDSSRTPCRRDCRRSTPSLIEPRHQQVMTLGLSKKNSNIWTHKPPLRMAVHEEGVLMVDGQRLLVAKNEREICLLSSMANRHGLIAGATGTGKTVTLKVMAENFSAIGVPVFLADIKGDLSGLCEPGSAGPKIEERRKELDLAAIDFQAYPVEFWDVFAEQGIPVRTTISEMGPLLLSRLLGLNEIQTGVMNIVFKIADDNGLLLLDLKDLKAMLSYVADNAAAFTADYGTVTKQTVGIIQRGLLTLEQQGAEQFFNEPALSIDDMMQTVGGKGQINILSADKLLQSPALYSTFLLWLLAELYEQLPEVGDLDKPKFVFFFDEAHLLFADAPRVLLDKIEQVVRLVRSKGVGIYFVTQNPLDIPDIVLGQLGNRVQHALRAYTPRDQKAVKAAAETFRANPKVDVEKALIELGVGEALLSFLDAQGRPEMVERAKVIPPRSLMGPCTAAKRSQVMNGSSMRGKYDRIIDRDSAYENLQRKVKEQQAAAEKLEREEEREKERARQEREVERRYYADRPRRYDYGYGYGRRPGRPRSTMAEKMARQAVSTVGRELVRGILGSLLR